MILAPEELELQGVKTHLQNYNASVNKLENSTWKTKANFFFLISAIIAKKL